RGPVPRWWSNLSYPRRRVVLDTGLRGGRYGGRPVPAGPAVGGEDRFLRGALVGPDGFRRRRAAIRRGRPGDALGQTALRRESDPLSRRRFRGIGFFIDGVRSVRHASGR